jgi:hypothetical protein
MAGHLNFRQENITGATDAADQELITELLDSAGFVLESLLMKEKYLDLQNPAGN